MESESQELDIRRARPGDFRALAALDREVWTDPYTADGDHVWRHWVEDALVFAALRGAEVHGAVLAFPVLSGGFCLHKMFVRFEYRSRGLGGRLMGALLETLDHRAAPAYLTVSPGNEPALRLYRSFGFEIRETVAGYYGPGQDRHILQRPGRRGQ